MKPLEERVKEFMESNGWEWIPDDKQWYMALPYTVDDFTGRRGQYVWQEEATFWYRQSLEARRAENQYHIDDINLDLGSSPAMDVVLQPAKKLFEERIIEIDRLLGES
jgi:hypothetical protein